MKKNPEWQRVKWHGNDAEPYASWECHALKVGRGKVVLYPGMWPKEGWSYVASFGANSERSHSGFLKGTVSLDMAKAKIEREIASGGI